MSLRLTPGDQSDYERLYASNEDLKKFFIGSGDLAGAKRMRQANTRLYEEFALKQITGPVPPHAGTIEERITRIEAHLGLNQI